MIDQVDSPEVMETVRLDVGEPAKGGVRPRDEGRVRVPIVAYVAAGNEAGLS